MDIWQQLYACLSINHNFNSFVKMEDVVWKGWVQALTPHEHLMPGLIKAINNGKLAEHLTVKRKAKIDLQDVKTLLKSLLRNQNLDSNTEHRLSYTPKNKLSPAQVRDMLDRAKTEAEERKQNGESLSDVTKKRYPDMPINKYFK